MNNEKGIQSVLAFIRAGADLISYFAFLIR